MNMPKLPPQDLEVERAVLGAILLDPRGAGSIAYTQLIAGDFYRRAHQLIFAAMLRLDDRNEALDQLTLAESLRAGGHLDEAGGMSGLAELLDAVASASNIRHHCSILRDRSVRRGLLAAGFVLQDGADDLKRPTADLIETVERELMTATCGDLAAKETKQVGQLLDDELARIEKLIDSPADLTGLSTGLADLDRLTSGLHAGDLAVLAARPSMGKTALALGIARAVTKRNGHVLLISLEMSAGQLTQRLLSMEAEVNLQNLRTGRLTQAERWDVIHATERLRKASLSIDDRVRTLAQLRATARRLHRQRRLDLLIIDYLQLLEGSADAESRQQEIADASRSLKLLARELDIPVLVLSQLNRNCEARTDKRPLLSDLRESGAIEQDADIVLFIYRDEFYDRDSPKKGVAEILVRKHRNGPVGDLEVRFDERRAQFTNLYVGQAS